MNKQNLGIIVVVIIILIGAGIYISSNSNKNKVASESTQKTELEAMENSNAMKKDEAMMNKTEEKMSDNKMMSDDKMMAKAGSYKNYSLETVKSEQEAGNKVVLFFHASWCPFCKSADKAFTEGADKIPSGVTILKTDYDSNSELKTKHGVTTQHTFVQIDKAGNQITKWVSGDIDNLIKNLK